MKSVRTSSFWRTSLNAELLAAVLAGGVLLGGSWIALSRLQQSYVQLAQADAERVNLYLREHLAAGSVQLQQLAELPVEQLQGSAPRLLQVFSDLYLVDAQHQVRRILKSASGSRVFMGFSFAGSRIEPYLHSGKGVGSTSHISRGLEDERASIYIQHPLVLPAAADGRPLFLLGRLNLSYIQGFLNQFSRFSGNPVLLVTRDGFVMLSSQPLQVPAVDLSFAASAPGPVRPLTLEGQQWLPVVSRNSALGASIVTLVPLDRLFQQQQLVLLLAATVALLMAVVFVVKTLRMRQQLFGPISSFINQLVELEMQYRRPATSRVPLTLLDDGAETGASGANFLEIQQIRSSFTALMQVIHQRDLILQQQLRTSLTAATIAHEINQPLATIHLLCQLAQDQLGRDASGLDIPDLISKLDHQSQEVNRVIERMRMLLRNVKTELHPTDITSVVSSACLYLKAQLQSHQVQLCCSGLDRDDLMVEADAGQLQMAITNLLRNASDAVSHQPPERRLVALSLLPSVSSSAAEVILRIEDSGPGFRFDPSDDTLFHSSKAAGTGLGLFVVRTTLANHQGSLELGRSSRLGGAQVSLVLPLLSPSPA